MIDTMRDETKRELTIDELETASGGAQAPMGYPGGPGTPAEPGPMSIR